MNVTLYMATTPNGFIAKKNDDTSWVSATEWKSFRAMIKKTGNIIIGKRTYDIMVRGNEIKQLENVLIVVMTHEPFTPMTKNTVIAKTPSAALTLMKGHGFTRALVAGGGATNGSFLKEGLVNDIYLDIEPLLFNNGIPLCGIVPMNISLLLKDVKKISKNEVQLHYAVTP